MLSCRTVINSRRGFAESHIRPRTLSSLWGSNEQKCSQSTRCDGRPDFVGRRGSNFSGSMVGIHATRIMVRRLAVYRISSIACIRRPDAKLIIASRHIEFYYPRETVSKLGTLCRTSCQNIARSITVNYMSQLLYINASHPLVFQRFNVPIFMRYNVSSNSIYLLGIFLARPLELCYS